MRHFCKNRTKYLSLPAMLLAALWGSFSLTGPARADQLGELTRPILGRTYRASSGQFDPESNLDSFHIEGGQKFTLAEMNGPGEIRHMWFTLMSVNRRVTRALMLRIYYDGSDVPSVESPIGDFFVAGNGMKANVKTLPYEISSYGRALNCYWRMPFKKSCRIEIENQSRVRSSVYFHCEWMKLDSLPDDTMYFYARYRQEYPAKPFTNYTVCDLKGEGHYVGTVLSSQSNVMSWFGEADDRFFVDGEKTPSIVGTGTEDYFNDAWNLRVTSGDRVGTTICEPKGDERRLTCYRWHIDDPVTFKKSLKMTIERRSYMAAVDPKTGVRHSYDFKYRPDYWSSVAFWYQKGITEKLWDIPGYKDRILDEVWVEPTQLVSKTKTSQGLKPRRLYNRTCNMKEYFYIRNDAVGAWFELPVTIKNEGRYSISIIPNLYKEHGVWKIVLIRPDKKTHLLDKGFDMWDYRVSREEDWPENFEHGTTIESRLRVLNLKPGDYRIRFECVGANPLTRHPDTGEFGKGCSIGLDALCFRRLPIEHPYEWVQDYLKKEKELFAGYVKSTKETIQKLSEAIEAFHRDKGSYPKTLGELVTTGYWKESEIPIDAWEQEYRYRAPGLFNPLSFDVWSIRGCSRNPIRWIGNWKTPFKAGQGLEGVTVLESESFGKAVRLSKHVGMVHQKIASFRNGLTSGGSASLLTFHKPDDWAEIDLPKNLPNGTYEISVSYPTSWNYGIVNWTLGKTEISPALDMYSEEIGAASTPPVKVELTDDPASRVLRAKAVGKSEASPGYFGGIDAIVLKPTKVEQEPPKQEPVNTAK